MLSDPSNKLTATLRNLAGRGVLTETDVHDDVREIGVPLMS